MRRPLAAPVRFASRLSVVAVASAACLASVACLSGCHESELEPKTPDGIWDYEHPGMGAEAAYMMAPVPAVIDPAPVPHPRARSVSLGYLGDAPLGGAAAVGPHWPYVQEPFHYVDPYGPRQYGRGHWVRVSRQ